MLLLLQLLPHVHAYTMQAYVYKRKAPGGHQQLGMPKRDKD